MGCQASYFMEPARIIGLCYPEAGWISVLRTVKSFYYSQFKRPCKLFLKFKHYLAERKRGQNDSKTSRIGREIKILFIFKWPLLPCCGGVREILPRNVLLELGVVWRYVRKKAFTEENFSSFSSSVGRPDGQKNSLWETRNAKRQSDFPKVTPRTVAAPTLSLGLNWQFCFGI